MKQQRKKIDDLAETQTIETAAIAEVEDGEETKRLRSLTVQEVEQILKDDAPE